MSFTSDFYERGGSTSTQALATARWTTTEETAKFEYKDGDFWLGETPTEDATPLGYLDDRHICLVSGSRGGKGTTCIINNLCLWPGSIVVVDPKGENATVTARRRGGGSAYCEGMGQDVHILDPFNTVHREDDDFADLKASFNPLDTIDPFGEEAIDEAGRVADALVVVQASNDPFWEESARSLIRGLILHVLTDDQFDGQRNLITVRRLITQGDWIGLGDIKDINKDREANGEELLFEPEPYELLWDGLSENSAHDGVITGVGTSYANMSEKARDSVLQVANRNTEFIDSPGMKRCLASSTFELADLKISEAGVSLFLSLPQRYMNTHFRWLRMMISLTITEMERTRGQPRTGHRILMCLDEFAGLKKLEVVENAAAQIAGFGVKLFIVLQTLGQLKETYKENWQTFLANSGLKLFFQIEDEFTRMYISKQLGETELVRTTETSGKSNSSAVGTSSSNTSNTSQGSSTGQSSKIFDGPTYQDGKSNTFSSGSSDGTSETATSGETSGTNQSIHKTLLLSPDEVGRFFARIDDPENPRWPGLSLAVVPGSQPLRVRKANYFAHPTFIGTFDPHPDFEAPMTLEEHAEKVKREQEEADRFREAEEAKRREEEARKKQDDEIERKKKEEKEETSKLWAAEEVARLNALYSPETTPGNLNTPKTQPQPLWKIRTAWAGAGIFALLSVTGLSEVGSDPDAWSGVIFSTILGLYLASKATEWGRTRR